MKDEQIWALYFAGIAALRFHPKNDETGASAAYKLANAAGIADMMLKLHRERFKCAPGSQEQ